MDTVMLVAPPDTDLDCAAQTITLFNNFFKNLSETAEGKPYTTVAYTFYAPNIKKHWAAVDEVRRNWWGDSKPTSTFLELPRMPNGGPWGNAKVAIEVVTVIGEVAVTNLYLNEKQFKSNSSYCHAKVVETAESKEVFFSGMSAIAGNPKNGYRILGEGLIEQAHFALMYCRELCEKTDITWDQVNHVDVFYVPPYLPKYVVGQILAETVDEKVFGFFPKASISLIPVTGLKPGLLVEIRPHARQWK